MNNDCCKRKQITQYIQSNVFRNCQYLKSTFIEQHTQFSSLNLLCTTEEHMLLCCLNSGICVCLFYCSK